MAGRTIASRGCRSSRGPSIRQQHRHRRASSLRARHLSLGGQLRVEGRQPRLARERRAHGRRHAQRALRHRGVRRRAPDGVVAAARRRGVARELLPAPATIATTTTRRARTRGLGGIERAQALASRSGFATSVGSRVRGAESVHAVQGAASTGARIRSSMTGGSGSARPTSDSTRATTFAIRGRDG